MTESTSRISAEFDTTRILERPDGFYWENKATGEQFGPFATLAEAQKDMEYGAEDEIEVAETAEEAEDEVGIADWIDPETGLPAEGSVPRIEDH
jgi:hypothetical protein